MFELQPEVPGIAETGYAELIRTASNLLSGDHQLDIVTRPKAMQYLRELLSQAKVGEPAMLVDYPLDDGPEIKTAGLLSSPITLANKGDTNIEDGHLFALTVTNPHNRSISRDYGRYSFWAFTGDVAANRRPRLIAGEKAVLGWFSGHGLATLKLAKPTYRHMTRDIMVLSHMQKMRLTPEQLRLTQMQREILMDACMEVAFTGRDSMVLHDQSTAYDVLEYVGGVTTSEQRQELYAGMAEELTTLLPVSGDRPTGEPNCIHIANPLAARFVGLPGLEDITNPSADQQTAALMALLYRQRADTMPLSPIAPQPDITFEQKNWPTNTLLNIHQQRYASEAEKWDDIARLNHMRAAGINIEDISLTDERRQKLAKQFMALLVGDSNAGQKRALLHAYEYAFGAHTPEEREVFYNEELLPRLAAAAPLHVYSSPNELRRYAATAETVNVFLPDSLQPKDKQGQAATAAFMGRLYELYLQHSNKKSGGSRRVTNIATSDLL